MSENVQKIQQMYAAFGRGDVQTILDNVAPDITWGTESVVTDVPWYPVVTGPAAVANFFATLDRELEFTKFDPKNFVASGDQVLVKVDIGFRIKKNGAAANITSVHEFVVGADGKVTKYRAVEDTAAVARAWNAKETS